MPTIPFSKFNLSIVNLSSAESQEFSVHLNDALKKYIIGKLPAEQVLQVSEKLKSVVFDFQKIKGNTLTEVIKDVLLNKFRRDAKMKSILEKLSTDLQRDTLKVEKIVGLDIPLKSHPSLRPLYFEAKTNALGKIIKLSTGGIKKLGVDSTDIDDLGEEDLKKLVANKVLTEKQGKGLALAIDLSRLSGENMELVAALHNDSVTVEDFILHEPKDWKKILTEKKITLPENEDSIDTYAENLAYNMEISFPQKYFLSRVIKTSYSGEVNTISAFDRVRSLGTVVNDGGKLHLSDIKWVGVNSDEVKTLEKSIATLQTFTNTYKHLGLVDIITDENRSSLEKKEAIQKRLDSLKLFYENNKTVDFTRVDFLNPVITFNFSGIPEEVKPDIRAQAMAHQRMLHIGEKTSTALQLLAKGYSSSMDITQLREQDFIKSVDLPRKESIRVYKDAMDAVSTTAHLFQAITDIQKGGLSALPVNNLNVVYNDLKKISGLDQIFGKQNFCACDHCKSILSPAAYFVDLMLFIDKNITKKTFTGTNANHPIKLQSRRPDLWNVPLTCQNTTTEIPYLDVVNDILEQYIQSSGIGIDTYEELSKSADSIDLPLNLPLKELRTYLGHFGFTLYGLHKQFGSAKHLLSQEKLQISTEELEIISTQNIAQSLKCFGSPSDLNAMTVSDFVRYAKISRADFDELLELKSIPEISGIEVEIIEDGSDIQQFKEVIKSGTLTPATLDICNRFLRLWKKTSWTIGEFDLLLHSLKEAGLFTLIEEKDADNHPKILILADLTIFQARFKLNVEELCVVASIFPATKLKPFSKRLYERIFNHEKIFGLVPGSDVYQAEIVLADRASLEKAMPFLLAGLGITEHEFNLLLKLTKTDDFTTPLVLNNTLLARFYRQVKIAAGLGISIDSLISAAHVYNQGKEFQTIDQINNLLEAADWLNRTRFDFRDVHFILYGDDKLNIKFASDTEGHSYCLSKLDLTIADVSLPANSFLFGIADIKTLSLNNLKSLVTFSQLSHKITDDSRIAFKELLKNNESNSLTDSNIDVLARIWNLPGELIRSISDTMMYTGKRIHDLERIYDFCTLCTTLGIQGNSLFKIDTTEFTALEAARNIVFNAFSSKYPEEGIKKDKLEPYHDKINTIKRDALCDYIIANQSEFKFKDRSDLYHFFLLDVEMSGCFRTSKILSAISSLQLYVHRCLINLEQSASDSIKVRPKLIPVKEWEWRKNYRVWEANRNVFLYPENYIDPSMRDTKTPLFKELEDELLQQNITLNTAENAYKKYMSQFVELARLRYAGAYYQEVKSNNVPQFNANVDSNVGNSTTLSIGFKTGALGGMDDLGIDKDNTKFYLVARTHLDPYQYYYRTFHHYKKAWGHWQIIDLPIEAAEVSTIVHNGNLMLFWTEVQHKEVSSLTDASFTSESVDFKVTTKYSILDVNGKWSSPQRLYLGKVNVLNSEILLRLKMQPYSQEAVKEQFDKNADSLIAQYKAEVFRKPYVSRTDNNRLLNIRHIFTPGKNFSTRTYITSETNVWGGNIPQLQFIVPDNNFDLVDEVVLFDGRIVVKISSPGLVGATSYLSDKLKFTQPLDVLNVIENVEGLFITQHYVDTYNYTPNLNLKFNKEDDKRVSSDLLYKECSAAFGNENPFLQYIEDGTLEFDQKRKSLTQIDGVYSFILSVTPNKSLLAILDTILTEDLNATLSEKGIEQFLSLRTQNKSDSSGQKLDFNGPYGAYYWELFFHIPFLIANHLNANQDFKGAKWWYERIFNPASTEDSSVVNPGEHYWQFREFRDLNITRLEDILLDQSTISVYQNDPFDPHAIARLRISAYQKSIVIKYIDNLLDWGDHLFAQDTQESILEANMLYQLAKDILGNRPEKIGKCQSAENTLTYQAISTLPSNGTEFFINLENLYARVQKVTAGERDTLSTSKYLSKLLESRGDKSATPSTLVGLAKLSNAKSISELISTENDQSGFISSDLLSAKIRIKKYTKLTENKFIPGLSSDKIYTDVNSGEFTPVYDDESLNVPASEIVQQSILAFCVPPNDYLFQYWDIAADRQFKIRNCMNISGIRRSLALFQPPIDPMLLVRAQAAGLNLEEVGAGGPDFTSPYRFVYLLEKAKQYAQHVQAFGAALLSALEKKDGEELMLLRSVHERNILKLSKDIKNSQILEAKRQFKSMEESVVNVERRIDYYQGLIEEGLSGWEITQATAMHQGHAFEKKAAIQNNLSSMFHLIPQLGSPFSLNFGGRELGDMANATAQFFHNSANLLVNMSSSAGLQAGFQRRKVEWDFQLNTAKQELRQLRQQLLASEIRLRIAEKDFEIHEKTIEQAQEIQAFYSNKFTNLGLYNYMATTLHRLHRESFGMAMKISKSAEESYKLEISSTETFLDNNTWQNERAGLLSGENLMQQLLKMEQSYLNNNHRELEITKHVSLNQLNPIALINLRRDGICKFDLPQEIFDLDFPGHHLRRIKSVSISIPCILGTYSTVNAMLHLWEAKAQIKPMEETLSNMMPVVRKVAASSAQNDSGIFELNFRDERYLPFEGAGVVSRWELELMTEETLRQFDYNTISDVIMHVRYTAREEGRSKATVIADLETKLNDLKVKVNELGGEKQGFLRLIQPRFEFPAQWHKMKINGTGELNLPISKEQFPYLVQLGTINIKEFLVYRVYDTIPKEPQETINGTNLTKDQPSHNLRVIIPPNELDTLTEVYIIAVYTIS